MTDLTDLRLRAEQYLRERKYQELLAIVPGLRADDEWWAHLWAPGAAIAAGQVGDASAMRLLEEAVAGGFSQPELFGGELEQTFGQEAGWAELRARMDANVPVPELELLDWPDAGAQYPLSLYEIAPDRVDLLRARLPPVRESAWETAVQLLEWVHVQWEHANDHVAAPDAVTVLERVDAGERFACIEYTIVLSQALNAVGIPARRLELRQAHHHAGVGRGHVVSEAWIDELDRWVVLDGQNGSYWIDADGNPLGVRELTTRSTSAVFVPAGAIEPLGADEAAAWFSYFVSYSTTGVTPAKSPFAPSFQGYRLISTPRLARDDASAHPRLSDLTTSLTGTVDRPVVRFEHLHPYGLGVRLHRSSGSIDGPEWPLELVPGEHELAVSVVTPYGETVPRRFAYRVSASPAAGEEGGGPDGGQG